MTHILGQREHHLTILSDMREGFNRSIRNVVDTVTQLPDLLIESALHGALQGIYFRVRLNKL